MNTKTAVLMMAYGGPNALEDVEPYLLDVRGGRPTSRELIEEVRSRYAAIGGKSPLLEITCRQAKALEERLNQDSANGGYQVFVGMRHWYPYIREAVGAIAQAGITNITAICMTPFFSRMSTGAYYEHLQKAIEAQAAFPQWQQALCVRKVGAWYTHPTYIRAVAANVTEGLSRMAGAKAMVLFSAHSLPAMLAEQGDPYADQFQQLAGMVAEQAGLPAGTWQTCFQSAGAQNTRWLGPGLEEKLHELAGQGVQSVLSAPIGFLSDHVEVLYDIDIEAQRIAGEVGITLERIASLNDQALFMEALREIIQREEQSGERA